MFNDTNRTSNPSHYSFRAPNLPKVILELMGASVDGGAGVSMPALKVLSRLRVILRMMVIVRVTVTVWVWVRLEV